MKHPVVTYSAGLVWVRMDVYAVVRTCSPAVARDLAAALVMAADNADREAAASELPPDLVRSMERIANPSR